MKRERVALEAGALNALDHVRVFELPRYVRPYDAEHYWHIPRSASTDGDLYSVLFWCGQQRMVSVHDMTENRPAAMLCGSCDGRSLGREKSAGLVYSPRNLFALPRFCPGWLEYGDRRCRWCGSRGSYRRGGGGYSQRRHSPGDLLTRFEPCERHGWKRMEMQPDRSIQCRGYIAGGHGWCGYTIRLPNTSENA